MFYLVLLRGDRRLPRGKTQDTKIMTKRELKKEIDQLRNDMAAEFVKRDDDIVKARTEGILAHNALAADLASLEKRLKNTEDFVGMQTDSIAAVILACGLREGNKFMDASEQIKREKEKLSQIIAKARAKYEAPKVEKIEATKPEAEADLFSSIGRRRRAPETKDRYEGLISVDRMMRRTGKTYKEITEMAKARGLYIVKKKGHNFVRITDEIYYK